MTDQEKSENEIENPELITEGKSGDAVQAPIDGTDLDRDSILDLLGSGPYSAAVAEYLDGADWLDPILDRPLMVHARSIAASLDLQMTRKGEIQSALAGSFDKALFRLDARRPKPEAGPGSSDPAQTSVFDFLSD